MYCGNVNTSNSIKYKPCFLSIELDLLIRFLLEFCDSLRRLVQSLSRGGGEDEMIKVRQLRWHEQRLPFWLTNW